MTVRDKKGNIAAHTADALLFAGESDCQEEQLALLTTRYPDLLAQFEQFVGNPKSAMGAMKPVDFPDGKVIFLKLPEKPGYLDIRQAFAKIVGNATRLKINHLACVPVGSRRGEGVHPDAVELVAKAAIGEKNIAIDVYTEHAE